jgi:transcriptional regulator with XRE-family HTH domain
MFNERLKHLRQKAALSQRALADKLGVSQQTVGKWEGGGATPNPDTLATLADIFCVSVDFLIGRAQSEYDEAAVKFALFGGEVDDETYEEVKRFAKFAQQRKKE